MSTLYVSTSDKPMTPTELTTVTKTTTDSIDSICSFLFSNGRIRELGLYRLFSKGSLDYRLFNRKLNDEFKLVINNWSVSAQPAPIIQSYGMHKFYAGYGSVSQKESNFNCRILTQGYLMVCESKDPSNTLQYLTGNTQNQRVINCTECHVPEFVEKMGTELFTQIQGVVPFNQSEESYLILFKIRDRLQYCFTEEREVWHNFDFHFN